MMKRITGILLSIGIILYILPMTAFAADGIVTGSSDYEALRQFLVQFDCGWARGQVYDAHNLTLDNGSRRGNKNIMEAVLTNPSCALLNLYPGEDTKEYGTTGPLEKADPLDKFMMYYKMDANKIDWTLQNIFNCSQNDIAKLRTTLNIAGDSPYYSNGYYYSSALGVGGFFVRTDILEITKSSGQRYNTVYEIRSTDGSNRLIGKFFAIVELKTIDGSRYWSLHYYQAMSGDENPLKTGGFFDVDATAYYCTPVLWAVENGVTAGTSLTTFSPNSTCTKAQILTFLWRAEGQPRHSAGKEPFHDIGVSDYYYHAAVWAYEEGLIPGGTFSPNEPCTRGMTMLYLWRLEGSPENSSSRFSDVPTTADYAQAVAWAVSRGVTSGTGNNYFSPNAICTRGQIVTFLYRYKVESMPAADLSGDAVAPSADWSTAYQNFVLSDGYLSAQFDYQTTSISPWGTDSGHRVSLYDFDRDGTPELIISNGYAGRIDEQEYIYTYSGGKVQYIGTCWPYPAYIPDTKYSGLFVEWWSMGAEDHTVIYYKKVGNQIKTEDIYSYSLLDEGNKHQITSDQGLFAASQKRDDWKGLFSSEISQIKKTGWDRFVKDALE